MAGLGLSCQQCRAIPMIVLAFCCGALPFSVWLGRLFLGRDVRQYADGNPGAANVFRAGGRVVGVLALLLDVGKAAAPVGYAYFDLRCRGLPMFLIAAAPLLGHAFSPFLGFRGGKAIATALGAWIGLTLWRVSLAAVLLVVCGAAVFEAAGWAVMFALVALAAVIGVLIPDPLLLAILGAQVVILAWTHRAELRERPHLRPWLARRLRRAQNSRHDPLS